MVLVLIVAAATGSSNSSSSTADGTAPSTGSAQPAPVSSSSPSLLISVAPGVTVQPAPVQLAPAAAGTALTALATLRVEPDASMAGYSRAQFGTAWTDDNDDVGGHNGCDTRNDILRRDLLAITIKAGSNGCTVLSGTLNDPYTATTIHFVRGPESALVQIDHVVALGDAWVTGAQTIGAAQRVNLANDPLNLLAVQGAANDRKGDDDAAGWLPANRPEDCPYVARQIAVKVKYHLWVTAAERAAMDNVLAGCPTQPLPTAGATPLGSAAHASAAPVTPAAPAPATHSAGPAPTTGAHPAGATARCNDGTYSYAAHHQGACSRHGGVAQFY